jgi:hypothetical protein
MLPVISADGDLVGRALAISTSVIVMSVCNSVCKRYRRVTSFDFAQCSPLVLAIKLSCLLPSHPFGCRRRKGMFEVLTGARRNFARGSVDSVARQ